MLGGTCSPVSPGRTGSWHGAGGLVRRADSSRPPPRVRGDPASDGRKTARGPGRPGAGGVLGRPGPGSADTGCAPSSLRPVRRVGGGSEPPSVTPEGGAFQDLERLPGGTSPRIWPTAKESSPCRRRIFLPCGRAWISSAFLGERAQLSGLGVVVHGRFRLQWAVGQGAGTGTEIERIKFRTSVWSSWHRGQSPCGGAGGSGVAHTFSGGVSAI